MIIHRVYEIRADRKYQYVLPHDVEARRKLVKLDCTKRGADWEPVRVHVEYPKQQEEGDFFQFDGGYLIINERVNQKLDQYFDARKCCR